MKILSLFDGMSCGRVALERAGIPVSQYLASEIDKHAITVSRKNYPDIVQLGDVRLVRQMAQAGLFGHVDLLIGGSPCQGFSFAGQQLAFNDPRSALFFEFVWTLQALREHNPNIKFLLENVKMKKEHLAVISQMLGVEPVFINSNLVSAQNRQRFYWANWSFGQPADKGIFLKDILETDFDDSVLLDSGQMNRLATSTDLEKKFSTIDPIKAQCMTARQYANWKGNEGSFPVVKGAAQRGRPIAPGVNRQHIEIRNDDKSNALTCRHKDSFIASREIMGISENENGYRPYKNDGHMGSISEIATIYKPESKSGAAIAARPPHLYLSGNVEEGINYRKLTPVECERLQTVPDGYTKGVSNTQRYKMLGNGWTVDVIAHILRSMPR